MFYQKFRIVGGILLIIIVTAVLWAGLSNKSNKPMEKRQKTTSSPTFNVK